MDIYFTSRRTKTHYSVNTTTLVYVGPSLDEAVTAVDHMIEHKKPHPASHQEFYSALPHSVVREFVEFYENDDFWFSIVKVTFQDQLSRFHTTTIFVTQVVCDCGYVIDTFSSSEAYRLACEHVTTHAPGFIVDRRLCNTFCIMGLDKPDNADRKWHHNTCQAKKQRRVANEF